MHSTMIDFDSVALGTSRKHYLCRKKADDHYRLNAKRMRLKYDIKKVHIFAVGDVVTVRIPRIDRAATDSHRLPCVIVQKLGKKQFKYRLQCEFGVLDVTYPANELEVYGGLVKVDSKPWQSVPKISLREAAKNANPSNAFYGTSCCCKTGCHGKKCSCRKEGKPCTVRCHSGISCTNQSDSTFSSAKHDEKAHSQVRNYNCACCPYITAHCVD